MGTILSSFYQSDFVSSQLVLWAAFLLIGGAVYFFVRMLLAEQESRQVAESLDEGQSKEVSNFLLRITKPFFTQYVTPMIRGRDFWDNKRKAAQRKLITAGLKRELSADEFISFKLFLIIFFPIVLGVLVAVDAIDIQWYLILISGVLGWFWPDFWVKGRIEKRQREILKSFPFVVDLLALSTEAGLDFIPALTRVVEKAKPGPFIDEFEQMLKELEVGSSRADGLREVAYRINMTEISSFIAILVSADKMGASVGKILRQQSDQVRSQRFVRAEKMGAKAGPKLIMITVILILPAVLLLVAGPFVLSFFG